MTFSQTRERTRRNGYINYMMNMDASLGLVDIRRAIKIVEDACTVWYADSEWVPKDQPDGRDFFYLHSHHLIVCHPDNVQRLKDAFGEDGWGFVKHIREKGREADDGVDCHNFAPIRLEDAVAMAMARGGDD